jgi:hypothetical protein
MERSQLWSITAVVSLVALLAGLAAMVLAVRQGAPAMAPMLVVGALGAAVAIPVCLWYPDAAIALLVVANLTNLSEITSELVGVPVFQPLLLLAMASLGLGFLSGRLDPASVLREGA